MGSSPVETVAGAERDLHALQEKLIAWEDLLAECSTGSVVLRV
jgi:hypothetical protein